MTMGVVPAAKRKPMLPGKARVRMSQNPVTSVIGLLRKDELARIRALLDAIPVAGERYRPEHARRVAP